MGSYIYDERLLSIVYNQYSSSRRQSFLRRREVAECRLKVRVSGFPALPLALRKRLSREALQAPGRQ